MTIGAVDGTGLGVDPPYGIILDLLRAGMVVPFLGAAASRVGYKDGDTGFLPSGGELAEMLAKDASFPSFNESKNQNLATAASYYVNSSSRPALRLKLRGVFSRGGYESNSLHDLLAKLANNTVIVTTNYDTLLEQAFKKIGKTYDLAVYPADNEEYRNAMLWWPHGAEGPEIVKPNRLGVAELGKRNLIYKMHGSVCSDAAKWDSYVITEEDYVDFLSRMSSAVPPAFREYFSTRAFLFLGYGLSDWNLRVLLSEVTNPDVRSWAILRRAVGYEEALWKRRNVDLFSRTLEEFVAKMQQQMDKVGN